MTSATLRLIMLLTTAAGCLGLAPTALAATLVVENQPTQSVQVVPVAGGVEVHADAGAAPGYPPRFRASELEELVASTPGQVTLVADTVQFGPTTGPYTDALNLTAGRPIAVRGEIEFAYIYFRVLAAGLVAPTESFLGIRNDGISSIWQSTPSGAFQFTVTSTLPPNADGSMRMAPYYILNPAGGDGNDLTYNREPNRPSVTTLRVTEPGDGNDGYVVTAYVYPDQNSHMFATPPLTGTVAFYDGEQHIKTVPLKRNTAQVRIDRPSVGSHRFRAVYGGDLMSALGSTGEITYQVRDLNSPVVTLTPPACGRRSAAACRTFRSTAAAWRTLRGRSVDAGVGASKTARIQLNVVGKVKGKWMRLKGTRLVATTENQRFNVPTTFAVREGAWSRKLPKLPPATWTIWVRSIDAAGNRSDLIKHTVRIK